MIAVLAVLESRSGAIRKVSLEVLAAARQLADGLGGTVDALICADGPVTGADGLGAAGADRVLLASHSAFKLYSPDGQAATVAAAAQGHAAVVMAATATGRDLAPRVAARLGVSCATDVTALAVDGGNVIAIRPVYAGKALQRVQLSGSPALVSIRPNTFPPVQVARAGASESFAVPQFTARVTVTEIKAPASAALDVTEA